MDDHSGVTHFHWILSSPRPASHSTLPATNPGVPAAQVGVAYKQSLEMRWKPGSHFWNVLLRPSCARTRSALVSEVIDCSKNAQFMEGMIHDQYHLYWLHKERKNKTKKHPTLYFSTSKWDVRLVPSPPTRAVFRRDIRPPFALYLCTMACIKSCKWIQRILTSQMYRDHLRCA